MMRVLAIDVPTGPGVQRPSIAQLTRSAEVEGEYGEEGKGREDFWGGGERRCRAPCNTISIPTSALIGSLCLHYGDEGVKSSSIDASAKKASHTS
jgi:hypothetical protein